MKTNHQGTVKFRVINLNQLQLSAARYPDIKSFLEYTDSFQDEMVNDKDGIYSTEEIRSGVGDIVQEVQSFITSGDHAVSRD